MEIEEFCIDLSQIELSNAQRAIAILYFLDQNSPGVQVSPGKLAKTIYTTGLGNPHSSQLGRAMLRTKLVLTTKQGVKLKPTARSVVENWLPNTLQNREKNIDNRGGYLPEAVWKNTRGYIENIAMQVNGCIQYGFFDGASVLLRRLIETLLIECYEHERIQHRIQSNNGDYYMLNKIIIDAVDGKGLTLGRETKKILRELKIIGDRSAHNRRYNTVKADLERIQLGTRLAIDELIQLATLKR